MWVYSISPPSLSLTGSLTTEIYYRTEKKTGNTHTQTENDTLSIHHTGSNKKPLQHLLIKEINLCHPSLLSSSGKFNGLTGWLIVDSKVSFYTGIREEINHPIFYLKKRERSVSSIITYPRSKWFISVQFSAPGGKAAWLCVGAVQDSEIHWKGWSQVIDLVTRRRRRSNQTYLLTDSQW